MTFRQQLRWGIMGTAKIARQQVIPAMAGCPSALVSAIASRNGKAARAAASEFGIPAWHGSYEALLADPDVDAVYIPLPNHLHVPWTRAALEAGKHVLCEKPLALSAQEGQGLLHDAAKHPELKVMEAFMYRFHPQWVKARELVQDGAIGPVRSIQSFFSYFNDDPGNIRNQTALGGGALMDVGCYGISLARWIIDQEPQRVFGQMDRDPSFGTDRLFNAILDFGGPTATFTCSTQLEWHQRVFILGARGSIEIKIPFNPPTDEPASLLLSQSRQSETITFAPCNQYTHEVELFSRAVLDDTPVPTGLEDGVANMHVVEKLLQSEASGQWVSC